MLRALKNYDAVYLVYARNTMLEIIILCISPLESNNWTFVQNNNSFSIKTLIENYVRFFFILLVQRMELSE